jgi:hypothetical protein
MIRKENVSITVESKVKIIVHVLNYAMKTYTGVEV